MFKFLVFGLAAGFGYGAFRQYELQNGGIAAIGVLAVVAVILAFFAGRSRRPAAVATAIATANATAAAAANAQQAVVVNFNVADGARVRAQEFYGGLDAVEWNGGAASLEFDPETFEEIEPTYDALESQYQGSPEASS